MASCDEVTVWLSYAKDLGYIAEAEYASLTGRFVEVGKMLRGLQRSWR
jgi:four helix bundle protein